MDKVSFDTIMFGYAVEDSYYNKVKVSLPDVFPDKRQDSSVYRTSSGLSKNIIVNNNRPAISDFIINYNYIELPKMSGVGTIRVNDKVVIAFVGKSPLNGIILGKVR